VAGLFVREPGEGLDRVLERGRRLVGGRGAVTHQPFADQYETEPEWERRLHERLGFAWPCPELRDLDALWTEIERLLEAKGLRMGRSTYGGWDDGDPGLARAIWCLIAHLRPRKVVETGVARGITSRVILEGLQRNGAGHLWSIDLPPPDRALHIEIATAVPDGLRERWTYLRGSSRRLLPGLLEEVGEIGLFVHDSRHTARNVRFELELAWAAMRTGAVVVDDVDRNPAFVAFARSVPDDGSLVARADDGTALFGTALKGI
jgi:predicted O-methyltransferase YrrM